MGKIAVMISSGSANAPMSEHFGKAEWIMLAGDESGDVAFLPNDAANGKGAAGTIVAHQCTDAIFTGIGAGAVAHLEAAGIRGWAAPRGISGAEALALFRTGALPQVSAPVGHETGGGCCCSGGGAHAGVSSCCSH
jgi:predicted Fe-Mo cluster-binding NifX family protein